MKKLVLMTVAAVAFTFAFATFAKDASAVPAFARQTGNPCYACHFQHIPKLNGMGRDFKLSGFTQTNQDLIEDNGLSIPNVFNGSFIGKFRYVSEKSRNPSSPKIGGDRGLIEIPDELAILANGRMGASVGFLAEWSGGPLSAKVVYSTDLGFGRGGIYAYTTDGLGSAYGMELHNTSVARSQRGVEDRKAVYALQGLGIGSGEATGLGIFAGSNLWFLNVGLWGPGSKLGHTGTIDTGFDLSQYYRLAVTPTVGDVDLEIGIVGQSGKTKGNFGLVDAETPVEGVVAVGTDALGIDAQAQTRLGDTSVEVVLNYGSTKASKGADLSLYGKATGFSALVEVGFMQDFVGLQLGTASYDNDGSKASAFLVGVWANLLQNAMLNLNYSSYSGDGRNLDNKLILMLFFGA